MPPRALIDSGRLARTHAGNESNDTKEAAVNGAPKYICSISKKGADPGSLAPISRKYQRKNERTNEIPKSGGEELKNWKSDACAMRGNTGVFNIMADGNFQEVIERVGGHQTFSESNHAIYIVHVSARVRRVACSVYIAYCNRVASRRYPRFANHHQKTRESTRVRDRPPASALCPDSRNSRRPPGISAPRPRYRRIYTPSQHRVKKYYTPGSA
ncbi:hypothetical protein C8R44DRAFT_723917 [Mycena epipterygia]|nr:hypothetical protein C8R44DRAFT_723917 [Mycena epipterygia]